MKFAHLLFRGDYEDAYVYMGWLSCVTADRTVETSNLEYIGKQIDARLYHSAPIASYCFARNDWLNSEQFRAILKNDEIAAAFFRSIDLFPAPYEVQMREGISFAKYPIDIEANVILDLLFYNTRLYLGTDRGLFHADVDWTDAEIHRRTHKRHDAKCINLSARFGMINASCGQDGLFSSIDDFGVRTGTRGVQFSRTAAASVRSSWMGSLLANYASNSSVSVFRTEREKIDQSMAGERQIITGLDEHPRNLADYINATLSQHGVQEQSIQYTFNSTTLVFVYTYDSQFFCFNVHDTEDGGINIEFTKTQKAQGRRIVGAHPMSGGAVVIETDDRVFLLSKNSWFTLHPDAAISVRTFPRSKRFHNLVAITAEDGVHLISAVDDTHLLRKARRHDPLQPPLVAG